MSERPCRLYLLTPPEIADLDRFARDLEAALAAGDVAALQLRLKAVENGEERPASDAAVLEAGRALRDILHPRGVALIINDRPDLAAAIGADGVHIGQTDASYADARRALGPDATIGVTCHDDGDLAIAAAHAGADYVAFGAFFPTTTKAAKTRADLDLLRWWSTVATTPCVAIGGVTADNCATLAAAGADFVAVAAGVWAYTGGPAAAVAAFDAALASADDGPRNFLTE